MDGFVMRSISDADVGLPPARPPSGAQHEIRRGAQRAIVCEVGATLRSYGVDGVAVLDGFGVRERSAGGRGQVLAPWPNRLDAGRYAFEGREGRAALDEPEHGNAIHGFVRWLPWQVSLHTPEAVGLRCTLFPQPAYPWQLDLTVEYRLTDVGLVVTATATNRSDVAAPFGIGFHPYFTVGSDFVDDAHLTIPAARRLLTDERGLPVGDEPVQGTTFDFTAPRAVGNLKLDTAFTDLARGTDGRARARLSHPQGGGVVSLWVDTGFPYLIAYTGDTLELASRRRRGVAIEPMTCPPNAFRSGEHVIRLEPEQQWSGAWGIDHESI
jgi:aldose 1-epimerase